ncbi:hypothetical protein ATCC90586_002347 [Pythium insidiosum]|nr:hypothetical protein ATCC90586_002347 [Pythium insidiosum]
MSKLNARAESDQLFKLQVQGDKYARLLIEQKQRLRELDVQYRKVHEELKELRLKRGEGDQRGGGANAVRARIADEQRLKEDRQSIETINDKLQEYESTLKTLQELMGVDNYHDLLSVYMKKEEENFALFRYVQSLNNEIEQLDEDKHRIELETEKLQNQMKDGSVHARKRMIDDLVETRQRILKENAEYERLRASALREFQPIARAVDRLYNALGCNDVVPPGMASSSGNSNGDGAAKRSRKQSEEQMAMMVSLLL